MHAATGSQVQANEVKPIWKVSLVETQTKAVYCPQKQKKRKRKWNLFWCQYRLLHPFSCHVSLLCFHFRRRVLICSDKNEMPAARDTVIWYNSFPCLETVRRALLSELVGLYDFYFFIFYTVQLQICHLKWGSNAKLSRCLGWFS